MIKRIKIMHLLPLFILAILFFSHHNEVSAHGSIPDGNAMGSNYSPYEVDSHSYKNRRSIRADKSSNDPASGRKLVYDVYPGTSNALKSKWKIEYTSKFGKGNQPYLTFYGWSALVRYHHHTRYNHATYILAINNHTGAEKMYKTEMTNLSATKDLEYNRRSNDPDDVYNLCGPTVFNKRSDECNMRYDYVGFKAWIPLNELFPDERKNAEWRLYIVKNIEGRVVYDELRLPFEIDALNYKDGELTLSSGIDAGKLKMNASGVLRRRYINDTSITGIYFELGRVYQMKQTNSSRTTMWYGVVSPHDGGEIRWASSAYWTFGGDIAVLKYEVTKKTCPDGSVVNINQACQVNVTVRHVDANTGKVLRTDNKKATVGKSYSFSAEPKGTFKDSQNRPYVPVPSNQKASGTTPNNNFSVTFYYKVSLPDPSKIHEISGATVGKANGQFSWVLEKSGMNIIGDAWEIGRGDGTFNNAQYVIKDNEIEIKDNGKNTGAMVTQPVYIKANTPYKITYDYEEEGGNSGGSIYFYEEGTGNSVHPALSNISKGGVFQIEGKDRYIDIGFYKVASTKRIKYKNIKIVELTSAKDSEVRILNGPIITGTHYATRNKTYKVNASGVLEQTEDHPINYSVKNPNSLKGKKITFEFSYEYTNHYRENYQCTDKQGNDCFKWEFKDYTPVWTDGYAKKANWTRDITVDHKYGESFDFDSTSTENLSLTVGRRSVFKGDTNNAMNDRFTDYIAKENFTVDNSPTTLLTQTWLPINEEVKYSSDLQNNLYTLPNLMYYYPYDIDSNLRSKYQNKTPFAYSKYALPLRVEGNGTSAIYKLADNFFVTKNTGFLFSAPSNIQNESEIAQRAKAEYEAFTGKKYDDSVLNTVNQGSRYYFNIDGNSDQEKNKWYAHYYVVGKLGLSDVTFHIKKLVLFNKYLVGSALDDTVINEQQESVVDVNYPHSITVDKEKIDEVKEIASERNSLLHSFRSTDIFEKYNQLKNILPAFN
jgi:MucBP domain